LEQVVIGLVDHRHVDRRAAQEASGEQAAEAGPDDDDSRRLWCVGGDAVMVNRVGPYRFIPVG
jgi:hypothetical protein